MTAWPTLSKRFVARMLSAHAGLGLVAGAILYVLSLSGVLVTFHDDFARWEQPGAYETARPDPAAAARALQSAIADYQAQHGAPPAQAQLILPNPDAPRMATLIGGEARFVDADGGLGEAVDHPFSEFLIDLHYYLHLPSTLGLIVVGGFGAVMLGLVLSGFLAHPRIFRDAFRFRRSGNAKLALTDLHNRLSVWGAPFHVIVPLTGAMLGLSVLAAAAFQPTVHDEAVHGGFFAPTFGAALPAGETEEPLADVEAALANQMQRRPDVDYWLLTVENVQREGQRVEILSIVPDRLIFGEYFLYAPDGRYLGQQGLEDGTLGQQMIAAAYQLHFGSFGGLPVKLLYAALGLALCVVISSGITLWLAKRESRGKPSPGLDRAWTAVIWGGPALLAVCLVASVAGLAPGGALPVIFWLGLVALIAAAPSIGRDALAAGLKLATGALTLAGFAIHYAAHAGAYDTPAAFGVSLITTASALALAATAVPQLGRRRAGRAGEPAE
ncbi:MAG: PepSY-associated TM helix domain-containing protein [Oceanicaulis sp.]